MSEGSPKENKPRWAWHRIPTQINGNVLAGRIFGINSLTQESDVGKKKNKKIETTRDSGREEAISFSCSEPSQAASLDLPSIYLTKKKIYIYLLKTFSNVRWGWTIFGWKFRYHLTPSTLHCMALLIKRIHSFLVERTRQVRFNSGLPTHTHRQAQGFHSGV